MLLRARSALAALKAVCGVFLSQPLSSGFIQPLNRPKCACCEHNVDLLCHALASGWQARILQHEYDHIRGTLYVDRMHSNTFVHASVMPTLPFEAAMPLGPCQCSYQLD